MPVFVWIVGGLIGVRAFTLAGEQAANVADRLVRDAAIIGGGYLVYRMVKK